MESWVLIMLAGILIVLGIGWFAYAIAENIRMYKEENQDIWDTEEDESMET